MESRYAYLGPEGTFTEAAVISLARTRASDIRLVPYPTIGATLTAVRTGAADRAVVPIESSVEGIVTATVDDLAAGGDLLIQAETRLPIEFALLNAKGDGVVLSSINGRTETRTYAKPVVTGQGKPELSPEEAEAVQSARLGTGLSTVIPGPADRASRRAAATA